MCLAPSMKTPSTAVSGLSSQPQRVTKTNPATKMKTKYTKLLLLLSATLLWQFASAQSQATSDPFREPDPPNAGNPKMPANKKAVAVQHTHNRSSKVIVLSQVEQTLLAPQRIEPPENVFLGLPFSKHLTDFDFYNEEGEKAEIPISIGEPDNIDPGGASDISQYSLPSGQFFEYSLEKVAKDLEPSVSKRLSDLRRTPLYGSYYVMPREEFIKNSMETVFYLSLYKVDPKDVPGIEPIPAFRCRYAREVDLSGGHFEDKNTYVCDAGSFIVPKLWRSVLGTDVRRMWVECAVRS